MGAEAVGVAGTTTQAQVQALVWRMRADLEWLIAEVGPERAVVPGAMDDWTFKDIVAHLSAWRWWSVARMEAAVSGDEPVPPWSSDLDENREGDVDRINGEFYEASRDLPVASVLRDSRETFERLEAALLALPEEHLFATDRYPWLHGYHAAAIVTSSAEHLQEHREWLLEGFLAKG